MGNITKTVKRFYQDNRKKYWKAQSNYRSQLGTGLANAALRNAKTQAFVWHNWDKLEQAGFVRVRIEPDYDLSYDDLAGDSFDIELNADSVPGGARTIQAQEKRFKSLIEQDGVWGYIVERKGKQLRSNNVPDGFKVRRQLPGCKSRRKQTEWRPYDQTEVSIDHPG